MHHGRKPTPTLHSLRMRDCACRAPDSTAFGDQRRPGLFNVCVAREALHLVGQLLHAQAQSGGSAAQVGGLDDDYGNHAAQLLSDLVGGGQRLKALITQRDRASQPHHLQLLLLTPGQESAGDSVNVQLLTEGLARLRLPPASQVAPSLPPHSSTGQHPDQAHGQRRIGSPGYRFS